ncbi:MAG: hypothetical protein ACREEM_39370, partial [Blastocatellia bacterium]
MIRKTPLFITIISLTTLIALGAAPPGAATNDLPTAKPQYSSQDSERSKKARKQARKEAKKARQQAATDASASPASGHQHHAAAPAKPAAAMTGLGERRHPVTTRNAEAQRFFDQGLALVYAFNHDEAARSFRRAAELDPQLAMAWWGIALAVGPNYNEATVDAGRVKA